ncbi:hypothetical protein QUF64_04925 [Anaerolineales bacterium HSG6]|nr:hypothetical protein [Anaerolineales bacterium HSG6]MDM8531895.1 hypothetical protein [Anaerolineales bacterium HSG25]
MSEVNILTVMNRLRPKIQRNKIVKLTHLVDEIIDNDDNVNLGRREARLFGRKLVETIIAHLNQADFVKLGEIGSVSVSCDKDKKLRVNYRASKSIGTILANDFKGDFENTENAGLDEEGFARRWLEMYPDDIVVMRDKTTRSA